MSTVRGRKLLEARHGLDNLPDQDDQLGGSLRAGHDLQLGVCPGQFATQTVSSVSQQDGLAVRGWSGGQAGSGAETGTGGRSEGRDHERTGRTGRTGRSHFNNSKNKISVLLWQR